MVNRAVTYIRVSSTEQKEQGYSPDAQKRLLWGFARSNGFDIVDEFEDVETAGRTGRTDFDRMFNFVRKNGIKNILVEKTDRLTRNFKDYSLIEDLMKECDVTVYLVKEGTSISNNSSSNQKFIFGIKTLMAKNFLDNLSEETKKGMNEKVSQGEYPSKAPIGYLNVHDPRTKKNIIVVDEKNRALIEALFRLYATGNHSLQSLIQTVTKMGLTSNLPDGRSLNKATLTKTLQNPFYIGHFRWQKQTYKGTHEAIIDSDVWQIVQDVIHGKRLKQNNSKPNNQIPFIFKNLFECGECARCITAEIKKKKYVYYRCTKYQTNCSQPAVKEETILKSVYELLEPLQAISSDGVAYITAALKESLEEKRGWHDRAYESLLAEKVRLKHRLDKMYEDRLDEKITEEFYEQKQKEYTTRLEEIDVKISRHDRADINYYEFGLRILELAKNAKNLFESANPSEKQELLRYLLSNSTLKDGNPEFALKTPFSTIAKRSPLRERLAWGG